MQRSELPGAVGLRHVGWDDGVVEEVKLIWLSWFGQTGEEV